MKISRRFAAGLIAVMALSACTSKTDIGDGEVVYKPPPSSKSAAPRTTKPPPSSKPPSSKPPESKPPAGPEPETHKVTAPGFEYDPSDFAARVNDKVAFSNKHAQSEHSWTVKGYESTHDSGAIKQGETKTLTVKLAPGTYQVYCTVVTYMVAGSLEVYA